MEYTLKGGESVHSINIEWSSLNPYNYNFFIPLNTTHLSFRSFYETFSLMRGTQIATERRLYLVSLLKHDCRTKEIGHMSRKLEAGLASFLKSFVESETESASYALLPCVLASLELGNRAELVRHGVMSMTN